MPLSEEPEVLDKPNLPVNVTTRELALPDELTVDALVNRVNKMEEVAKRVMREGVHFGIIPGTDKPTLLKPGAEVLCQTFMFRPTPEVLVREVSSREVNYTVRVSLHHIPTGAEIGSGIGACSSNERKYQRQLGKWDAVKHSYISKTYNKEIESVAQNLENTILKMAKKRALVDAVLGATGASSIFTQDMEDIHENAVAAVANGQEGPSPQPPKTEPTPQPSPEQFALVHTLWDKCNAWSGKSEEAHFTGLNRGAISDKIDTLEKALHRLIKERVEKWISQMPLHTLEERVVALFPPEDILPRDDKGNINWVHLKSTTVKMIIETLEAVNV